MADDDTVPGPDPSSLRVPDHVPDGVDPIPMRITYSSDSVSDWISLDRSRTSVKLELAGPLLSIVRKVANGYEKASTLRNKLATISGLAGGLVGPFKETVSQLVNNFLPVPVLGAAAGFELIVGALKLLHNRGMLLLKVIHQADPEEFWKWCELMEQAKWTADITVD